MAFDLDGVLGKDCKVYRNTGSHASPVWVEMVRLKDVSVPLGKGKAEQKSRASSWKYAKGTFKEMTLSAGYEYKPGTDADFTALADSFMSGTPIELFISDGPAATAGSRGPRGVFEIFEFPFADNMEESRMIDLGAEITRVTESGSLVEPSIYEVPA